MEDAANFAELDLEVFQIEAFIEDAEHRAVDDLFVTLTQQCQTVFGIGLEDTLLVCKLPFPDLLL